MRYESCAGKRALQRTCAIPRSAICQVDLKEHRSKRSRGRLRARGLDVATETQCGDPLHLALVDRTKRTSADLVVKDTHHHSLAQRTVLTNTDWNLIRGCPVPLLLTKTRPWAARPRIWRRSIRACE